MDAFAERRGGNVTGQWWEGVNVPSARRYLPGTMVLETSSGTPTGWLVVRSAGWCGPRITGSGWTAGSGR